VISFRAPPPPVDIVPAGTPTFSVVIPAYEAADVVGAAVESTLRQTLQPKEIIVCDDGSTDRIDRALAPFSGRITLFHKENGGAASARNLGLHKASGDFVSFLDADDLYEPERLEATAELASSRPDLDIVMTDSLLEADGRVVGSFCTETPFAEQDQRLAILDRCFVAWPAVRRSRLIEIGGFDESLKYADDWDMWLRLIFAGARVGLVDVPLYRYRIRRTSLSGDRAFSLRDRATLIEKALRSGGLDPQERVVARRSLRAKLNRALLAEAEMALRAGSSGRRSKALSLMFRRGIRIPTRLRCTVAAIAPNAAAEALNRRESRTGHSVLNRSIPSG
jgi:glycosyltransferase involved in cell wall biosynthesis